MTRRNHHHAATIALTLARTASLVPAAWADPAPLAKAHATITDVGTPHHEQSAPPRNA